MTIGQIAAQVAKYFNRNLGYFVDPDDGSNLVISELNHVRLQAEQLHAFYKQQKEAWLDVDPVTGANLQSAKLFTSPTFTATAVRVNLVDVVYLQNTTQDSFIPIWVNPKKLLSWKQQEQRYRQGGYMAQFGDADYPLMRYPGDARNYASNRPLQAYWLGDIIRLDPQQTGTLRITMDVIAWMSQYDANSMSVTSTTASATVTAGGTQPGNFGVGSKMLGRTVTAVTWPTITLNGNANEALTSQYTWYTNPVGVTPASLIREDASDFMTEQFSEYLQWGAINRVNFHQRKFVPQREGFLGPPEKAETNAFDNMIKSDVYLWETARRGGMQR